MYQSSSDHQPLEVREVARGFTYGSYVRLEDTHRYELLRGVLFMVPAPTPSHQEVVARLVEAIRAHVKQGNLGVALPAPVDVVLSDEDVVQPDVVFVSQTRIAIVTQACIHGSPDLVVEVLSPATARYDREAKRQIYSAYGIKECWLVDPDAGTVEVLVLTEGCGESQALSRGGATLVTDGVYGTGKAIISRVLPDLSIDIDALFENLIPA